MTEMAETVWQRWHDEIRLLPALRLELQTLIESGAQAELRDRFAEDLQFGTGGLRAKMGVGTNRMNVYTVRRATAGVVEWIRETTPKERWRLAIGYDGRRDSATFAREIAGVAAARGVQACLFAAARPTPMLSFAVRHLQCAAGVMVTASHNPPEYNGYKVYGSDGGQILTADAERIVALMRRETDMFGVAALAPDDVQFQALVATLAQDLERAYYERLTPLLQVESADAKDALTIVYTPLHGTGGETVPRALRLAGYNHLVTVPEQSALDEEFTFVRNPNPEESVAYDLALALAQEQKADIVLATDPDADRVGMMIRRSDGAYELLTGNEVGALFLSYHLEALAKEGKTPAQGAVITTIVTSDFGETVAQAYGVLTERTLTGFKYIGDKIGQYEHDGKNHFVFGYEESVGYLLLPFVRDKDAIQAAVFLANMAASLKQRHGDLGTALQALYTRFGYYRDRLLSYNFAGRDGVQRMGALMADLRQNPLRAQDAPLFAVEDYLTLLKTTMADCQKNTLTLPASDVLKFRFAGDAWVAVRPSGTEPKLKVYIGVKGTDAQSANAQVERLQTLVESRLQSYLA
ncbi:MAG: phospho-sugar mutase [Bacilli bacterium]